MHQAVLYEPTPLEVNVDGLVDERLDIEYWGVARRQLNGKYRCLAKIQGALCHVEVSLSFDEQ